MTAAEVVIDGVWCSCVISEPQVKGNRWCVAMVTLPDGREITGVHHPDPEQARLSAWVACSSGLRSHKGAVAMSRYAVPDKWAHRIEVAENGCWLWTGCLDRAGYGQVQIWDETRNRPVRTGAHRVLFTLCVGPIPPGLHIDHLCHTEACDGGRSCLHRRCVNPAHLEPVSQAVNNRRVPTKNNFSTRKTACPRGHPYDSSNTIYNSDGARMCRICRNALVRARAKRVAGTRVVVPLAPDDPRHGTTNAYRQGCRCVDCSRAQADYQREYYQRRKQTAS